MGLGLGRKGCDSALKMIPFMLEQAEMEALCLRYTKMRRYFEEGIETIREVACYFWRHSGYRC